MLTGAAGGAAKQAWAIALGAPESTNAYPAVFAAANVAAGSGGGIGYYRSDNGGKNWVKINDAAHGFGSISSNVLTADPRVYSRCVPPGLLC